METLNKLANEPGSSGQPLCDNSLGLNRSSSGDVAKQFDDSGCCRQHAEDPPKEPQPDEFIALNHHRYKGREFYGEHAQELAEVHYLRDWRRWAEQRLPEHASGWHSISEAPISGDGSDET